MATAGPSRYRPATGQAESTQTSHSADSARQGSPPCIPLRSTSLCESFTKIPKPPSSHRRHSYSSLVHSSKTSSGPSRSGSPTSSPASSVQEDSITDEEAKEPEPDLPKAPEQFEIVFSVPKALFHIFEDSRRWHFSSAPMQNVHALVMEPNQANLKREKAEQQVRDLTQRLSSVVESVPKIQPSECERKCPEGEKVTPAKLRSKRCDRRRELIENPDDIPLEERFKELAKWSEDVEADIDAAQDRNMLLFDELGEAGKDIKKLGDEKLSLEDDKKKLQKQLEQSRKGSTMTDDDRTSVVSGAKPPQSLASQDDQENRLTELQRENDRLREENEEMKNALEQPQNHDSPLEEPEIQVIEAHPEEAHTRDEVPRATVQGANVDMEANTTGQENAAQENIEAPVLPVSPPAAPEAEEEAQQQQKRRRERERDARRPRRHHRKSPKVYSQKKKMLSPLAWVRYRRTLMDFLSFRHMFSSPLKLS